MWRMGWNPEKSASFVFPSWEDGTIADCWLPGVYDLPKNLQSHGNTGQLSYGVGHRADGSSQFHQVGNGVNYPPHKENEKVQPGYEGIWIQEGIDGSQEQKWQDVLQVIAVGSAAPFHI